MGAVELAIALHEVFESPREPIIWDVGHQAYAHKLLTGRGDRFKTLRQAGGLSGFLSREESEHDVFGAGHSSTAISAALGISWAKKRAGDDTAWTVAVIGDGGMTAGLALEALNNLRTSETGPLLIVLNDNQMSISPNAGAIPAIFSGGMAADFFKLFGADYLGPIDGHSLANLIGTFQGIKQGYQGRPVVVHAITEKGKGYAPAEESPASFHGVGPIRSGAVAKGWSQSFAEDLCALAERDPRIVAITAAMPEGTGLLEFSRKFPDRFFDVGIAEAHAVTFAAGLATQGLRPVVAVYSTFLQRGIDELIHDVALQKLGVTFVVDRAGVVGADGPTHHGAFDLAYLGMIPEFSIWTPASYADLREGLAQAIASGRPAAIRFPRGEGAEDFDVACKDDVRWAGETKSPRAWVAAVGPNFAVAREALRDVPGVAIAGIRKVKPIPGAIEKFLSQHSSLPMLTLESGTLRGGFGETLLARQAALAARGQAVGYEDRFLPHGTPKDLEASSGLSAENVRRLVQGWLAQGTGK